MSTHPDLERALSDIASRCEADGLVELAKELRGLREHAAPGPVDGLLPCPFCGSEPYRTRTVNGTEMFKIGCSSCGFELKAAWYRGEPKPTKDIADLWNRRAAPSSDALREALARWFENPVQNLPRLDWESGYRCARDEVRDMVDAALEAKGR